MSDPTLVEWLRAGEPVATEAPPETTTTPRQRPWLLAVAAGLWLGVAVVAGQWVATRPAADSAPEGRPTAEPAPAAVDPPAAPLPAPAALLEPPDGRRGDTAVQAHAVLAVRERLSVWDGPARRYVDLAVAESVRWHGTVAVVGVLAHLLEGDEDTWTTSRAARFGVAVTLVDGHPVVVAGPWPEAKRQPEPLAPTRAQDPDPALEAAAREALLATGYRDVTTLDQEESR